MSILLYVLVLQKNERNDDDDDDVSHSMSSMSSKSSKLAAYHPEEYCKGGVGVI